MGAENKLRGKRRQSLILAVRPAEIDCQVLAVNEAALGKSALECCRQVRRILGGSRTEEPDHRNRRLLRARRERPRDRAAEQSDKLAPSHSITSSASNCIELGTSMPSALAVCRLMTSSNLFDCKTGKSAGFSPLRIRPV
jgi:hypothetical protein